jgi:hypothetical protein
VWGEREVDASCDTSPVFMRGFGAGVGEVMRPSKLLLPKILAYGRAPRSYRQVIILSSQALDAILVMWTATWQALQHSGVASP